MTSTLSLPRTAAAPARAVVHQDANLSRGLALVRVAAGLIFVAHGAQKVFVFGLPGVIATFGQMGIALPGVTGPLVAWLELLGGAALAAGLFTRVAGAAFAIEMLGAIVFVHLKGGFFLPSGVEFALLMFAVTAALGLIGAGALSLDRIVAERRRSGS
jgi:putative oxidoreductase